MNFGRRFPMEFAARHSAALAACLVLLLAISAQSLWIDEITVAWISGQVTITGFARALGRSGSEAQMPFMSLYSWLWAKLFGTSELALRCANIPWILLGVFAMCRLFARFGCRKCAVLLLCSPFLCFYADEARPYMMTFAFSAATILAFHGVVEGETAVARRNAGAAFTASLVLCTGTSMLNFVVIPALAVYAALAFSRSELRRAIGPALVAAVPVGLLGVYYVTTMIMEHGGSRDGFSILNLGFAAYEWLGFGGLGPPRHMLRNADLFGQAQRYVGTLAVGATAWAFVTAAGLQGRRSMCLSDRFPATGGAVLAGVAMLACAAQFYHASLWGRHFMGLFPFFLLALGIVLVPAAGADSRLGYVAFCCLVTMFLLSSARQRLLQTYEKEPYREAVRQLQCLRTGALGLPCAWAAYDKAMTYYGGTVLSREEERGRAGGDTAVVAAAGWSRTQCDEWTRRHREYLLVLHRPDKFDRSGSWRAQAGSPTSDLLWSRSGIEIYHVAVR